MPYLNSTDIQIFPAVARSDAYQKDARLFTEESVTKPFKLMYNNESFVISTMKDINTNNTLEFVIGGYYVKIADFQSAFSSILTSNGTLYAGIRLATTNDYTELVGADNNGVYQGVEFGTSQFLTPYKNLSICDVTVSGIIQATSINTPAQVGGEKSEIVLPYGSSTPPALEEGKVYLDTTNGALYVGLGSSNLELREQGNTSDITAETITLSKSGGIASIVVKDTTNNPTVTIDGDTGSGITYTGKASINIDGSVNVTESVDTKRIYAENAYIDELDGDTEIPSGQKLINNGSIEGAGNISTDGTISAYYKVSGVTMHTTTVQGDGISSTGSISANSISAQSISGGNITVPTGKTLTSNGSTTLKNTTVNGTINANNTLTISNGGASITGATTISGNVNVTGKITATDTITSSGGFFSNGLIAPLFSTTIPSNFNDESVLNNTRTYCAYYDGRPTNTPSDSPNNPRVVTLEVFHTGSSNTDQYALQRYTNASSGSGVIIYYRTMKKPQGGSWQVDMSWRRQDI